ncbi:MAG: DUF192 domain-containing protein [Verrucomicrobia bacterium]|nr:DUF192 domain-containing protein [Verrucomicrobiota bacterium]MBU6446642.1 DUF192 domain-containing protein [Verrucomicrobiota bacterium]MDE3047403.1 DUF192 domain-containing protein [Verrucomicrobiota bacterium]
MRILIFLSLLSSLFAAEKTILLGKETLTVEIADTLEARRKGLMGRLNLPEGKGMLFIYDRAFRLTFWMKDTLIPLSIGFFDEEKKLIRILDMDPPIGDKLVKYRCTAPALYALEVPQGWFEKHNIQIGDKFSFLEPADQVK